jgi:putative membrane protein
MLHTDSRFAQAVEAAVTRLEASTDAEIVVVAAPRSAGSLDAAVLFGAGLAWLALLAMLWSPWAFHPAWIPIELALVGAFGAWAAHRRPELLRLLLTRRRLRTQVNLAADAAFHQEVVHGTRGRTGLLIYVSALEQRVALRPDLGLDALVPAGEWNAIRWGKDKDPLVCHRLEDFLAGLDAVGEVLARRVPHLEDNPNEIADAPRIRS